MPDEDRVSLDPLNPTQALKALLSVDPSAGEAERCPKTWEGKQCRLKAGHFGPCQYDLPA